MAEFIEDPRPLFQGEDWVIEERRLAWLYRIELLRESVRLTETLAWVCLEVEIIPDNVAAIALKERLKREAGFLRRPEETAPDCPFGFLLLCPVTPVSPLSILETYLGYTSSR